MYFIFNIISIFTLYSRFIVKNVALFLFYYILKKLESLLIKAYIYYY